MRNYAHWRVRRVLTVFLTTLLLVGSLIVPAGYLPIGVQSVAAETVVQSLTCDSIGSLGLEERIGADLEVVNTVGGDGTDWLMQNGAGALLVTDNEVNSAGGCIGLTSPYYWSVTAGNWYEIRFLSRTGPAGNGMNFRLGSTTWGTDLVSVTIADNGWGYHAYRFKPTGSQVYPWWYTYRDEVGANFYLDSIELASQPEKLTNNSFETDTSGWSVSGSGTLSRQSGGANGTSYCARLVGTSYDVAPQLYQSVSATSGTYYSLNFWAKGNSAYDVLWVFIGTAADLDAYLFLEVDLTTDWQEYHYNFRSTDTNIKVQFGYGGPFYEYGDSFYLDEVFLWSSRDEFMAQFNYRSYAMHQLVQAETVARLRDRYDDAIYGNETASRGMISLFLGEVWYKNHDAGTITNAEALLQKIVDHNYVLGSSPYRWGNDWQTSFELETLMLGVHWAWGDLSSSMRADTFDVITDELHDYIYGPHYQMLTNPTNTIGGYGPMAAHLVAWDLDYSPTYQDINTRAEDAAAWGAAMAYASNVFTATAGNGYWADAGMGRNISQDIMEMVISDNEDFTTYDSYNITNLTNVAETGTKKIGNHGYYPNPFYTIAILKPFTTAQFARKITGQAVPWQYEDDVADRMGSDIYQDNWDSAYIQDSGFITTSLTIILSGAITETNTLASYGEVVNRFKLYVLPAWFYLYDDTDAMYEAQRTMRLLQDNPAFWPAPVQVISDEDWGDLVDVDDTNRPRYDWWNSVYGPAEAFYQYSARYQAMRGYKYGLLPTGNQFVSAPLTW